MSRPAGSLRATAVSTLAFAFVLAIAGCGSSGGSSQATKSVAAVSSAPPAAGCGSFTSPLVQDSSGVIAKLPSEYGKDYADLQVQPSKWTAWKPNHSGPYKIQIVWSGLVNPFITDLQNDIKSGLQKNTNIGSIQVSNTGDNLNIAQQIQQMQAAIRQNPDLIVLLPLEPAAFNSVVQEAGARGIPVVTVLGSVESPYAVNVDINSFLDGALTTSVVARSDGGKGDLLTVQGYPGTTVNDDALSGVAAVVKHCPQMKVVGSVVGAFVNATAKASVTQFLATHPSPVNAVVQAGGMGPGVLQAFQGVGRPLPALGDIGASNGSLAYWQQHKSSFRAAGTGQSAPGTAATVVDVAERLLGGQGPLVNTLVGPVQLITNQNLKAWAVPGQSLSTPGVANGPPAPLMSDNYLSRLFRGGSAGSSDK